MTHITLTTQPLRALRAVEVLYAGSRPVTPETWPLAQYQTAYPAAACEVRITRPQAALPLSPEEDISQGQINAAIAHVVRDGVQAGEAICLTGGNCHHATGVVAGLQQAYGPDARLGLIWFDAHGDINTPQTSLSGALGGMPVAVCAGLAWPRWRDGAGMTAPLPCDRIVLVDVRDLDAPEEALVRAIGVKTAAVAPGFAGVDLAETIAELAARVDVLYLHIDADVLDGTLQPNHHTIEFNGPDLEQTLAAVELVMATGKVAAYAVVSVFTGGADADIAIASGTELVRGGLARWAQHGRPALS